MQYQNFMVNHNLNISYIKQINIIKLQVFFLGTLLFLFFSFNKMHYDTAFANKIAMYIQFTFLSVFLNLLKAAIKYL
jgi:hypothetical protein